MLELRRFWKLLSFVLVVPLYAGCGGGGGEAGPPEGGTSSSNSRPSGQGACGLLLQGEVDELFGSPVGAGLDEDLGSGIALCTWPASGEPRLLLQVGPADEDILDAVDLGEGYRVSALTELAGPAAVALIGAGGDGPSSVAVIALTAGEKTIVVSPIGLDLVEVGPRFERLKAIVDAAAGRI